MISAELFYIVVNVVLAAVCVVSIVLAFKYVPDKGIRNLLIVALVLLILSGGALSFCQKIFRLYSVAYMGDMYGVTDGAVQKVDQFRILLPIGNMFELMAIALCAFVGKKLITLRTGEQPLDKVEGGVE